MSSGKPRKPAKKISSSSNPPKASTSKRKIKSAISKPKQKQKRKESSQEIFLAAYSRCGNISKAAKASGIHRHNHFLWTHNDPEYPAKLDDAWRESVDWLAAEARSRAEEGVNEPVIYKGQQMMIGIDKDGDECPPDSPLAVKFKPLTVNRRSDNLIMFMLKAADPDKYRDKQSTVSVNVEASAKSKSSSVKLPMNPNEALLKLAQRINQAQAAKAKSSASASAKVKVDTDGGEVDDSNTDDHSEGSEE